MDVFTKAEKELLAFVKENGTNNNGEISCEYDKVERHFMGNEFGISGLRPAVHSLAESKLIKEMPIGYITLI